MNGTKGEASNWLIVTSGVPQGLVLEPILIIIISDVETGLTVIFSKFANDMTYEIKPNQGKIAKVRALGRYLKGLERSPFFREWIFFFLQ